MKSMHYSVWVSAMFASKVVYFWFDHLPQEYIKHFSKHVKQMQAGNPFPLVISEMRYGRFRKNSTVPLSYPHCEQHSVKSWDFQRGSSYMIGDAIVNHHDMHLPSVSFFTQFAIILCSRVQVFMVKLAYLFLFV